MGFPATAGAWAAYARAQQSSDPRILNSLAWGRDDAMSVALSELREGVLHPADFGRRIHSLTLNRSRKHGNRHRLNDRFRDEHRDNAFTEECQTYDAVIRELLQSVRRRTTRAEWELLWQLAEGISYADLATASGMSSDQLRVQVLRLRNRIREALQNVVKNLN